MSNVCFSSGCCLWCVSLVTCTSCIYLPLSILICFRLTHNTAICFTAYGHSKYLWEFILEQHMFYYSILHTQPYYGPPFVLTTRVGRYQKKHSPTHTWNVLWESVIILDFMRRGEDNRGWCTNNPAGCHPIQTINAPTSIIPRSGQWTFLLRNWWI